jgi:hypothetical protein
MSRSPRCGKLSRWGPETALPRKETDRGPFGIDLHQKHSEICGLDGEGGVKYQKRVTTSEASFRRVFGK